MNQIDLAASLYSWSIAGAHDSVRYCLKVVMVPISATNLDRPRHVRFPTVRDRTADIAGGPFRDRSGSNAAQRKSRPKAALQFKADDRGSGCHQCWL